GARVDVIARRARINKRMLYHYFGDKEGLFREVLRRKIADRSAWLAGAPEDPVERLPFWFQMACRDREWVQLLEWEALQWGEKKVIDEERRQESVGRGVERIRQQQARGLLNPHLDPGQLLISMLALTAYPISFPQLARLATAFPFRMKNFKSNARHSFASLPCCCGARSPALNLYESRFVRIGSGRHPPQFLFAEIARAWRKIRSFCRRRSRSGSRSQIADTGCARGDQRRRERAGLFLRLHPLAGHRQNHPGSLSGRSGSQTRRHALHDRPAPL